MKVLKFDGNAIATASKMHASVNLLDNKEKNIVAFSAVAGTNNTGTLQVLSDNLF